MFRPVLRLRPSREARFSKQRRHLLHYYLDRAGSCYQPGGDAGANYRRETRGSPGSKPDTDTLCFMLEVSRMN